MSDEQYSYSFDITKTNLPAKEEFLKQQEAFIKRFADYEPYDISEVGKIIQEVKEHTKGYDLKHKLIAYNNALGKINLVLHNNEYW